MLDDHDGVAQLDEPIEHVQQFGQVVEVQAGGRLVEQIERVSRVGAGEFGGQFHPLGLAAGERRGRLAEREIIEAHVAQRLQDAADLGYALEKLHGLAAGHVQHLGDRLAVIAHGERLLIVALAVARIALDPDVGQEVHLDAKLAVALALFATAAGHVETEPPRLVAAKFRLGQLGEERADQVQGPRERGRIGTGRLTQGLLIDADHLVDLLDAEDGIVGAGKGLGTVQRAGERGVEHVFHQRTLAAAAGTGDDGKRAQRDLDVDVLEVVVAGAADFEPGGVGGEQASRGRQARGATREILPSRLPSSRLLCPLPSVLHCSLLAIRRFVGTAIAFLPVR